MLYMKQMKTSYINSVIKCLVHNLFDTVLHLVAFKKNDYGDKSHFLKELNTKEY